MASVILAQLQAVHDFLTSVEGTPAFDNAVAIFDLAMMPPIFNKFIASNG